MPGGSHNEVLINKGNMMKILFTISITTKDTLNYEF